MPNEQELFGRSLTSFENGVKFKELNETFDTYEEAFVKEVGPVQRKQVNTLLEDIERILRTDKQQDLAKIKVKRHDEHVRAIRSILKRAAEDTVELTKTEFKKNKRVTVPNVLRVQNSIRAETLAASFEERIRLSALSTVLRGLKSNQSTKEIMFALRTPTNGS